MWLTIEIWNMNVLWLNGCVMSWCWRYGDIAHCVLVTSHQSPMCRIIVLCCPGVMCHTDWAAPCLSLLAWYDFIWLYFKLFGQSQLKGLKCATYSHIAHNVLCMQTHDTCQSHVTSWYQCTHVTDILANTKFNFTFFLPAWQAPGYFMILEHTPDQLHHTL